MPSQKQRQRAKVAAAAAAEVAASRPGAPVSGASISGAPGASMPSLRADAPEFLNIGASTSGASGILGGDARKVPMWIPMEPIDRDAGPTLIPTQLRGDGMPASDVQRVWEDSVQTVTQ